MRLKPLFKPAGFIRLFLTSFFVTSLLTTTFISPVYAQLAVNPLTGLPQPGTALNTSDAFEPLLVTGLHLYPDNPYQLDFILNRGQTQLDQNQITAQTQELVKYFLAALTTPSDEMWVNLSPQEAERVIPEGFGKTQMGRDLLAQDYLLKQLTSSLLHPSDEIGERFWNGVYSQAYEQFGTTVIPTDTFHKIWIAPGQARLYQHDKGVLVLDATLEVMLEKDYVAARSQQSASSDITESPELNSNNVSTNIMREVVLPAVKQEINQGATFAKVRQIYHAVILAKWFKQQLKAKAPTSFFGQYADHAKTTGIDHQQEGINQHIYQQYVAALKMGVMDFVQEEVDPYTGVTVPRHYFSGGAEMNPDLGIVTGPAHQLSTQDWTQVRHVSQTATDRGVVLFDVVDSVTPEVVTRTSDTSMMVDGKLLIDLNTVKSDPLTFLVDSIAQHSSLQNEAFGTPAHFSHPDMEKNLQLTLQYVLPRLNIVVPSPEYKSDEAIQHGIVIEKNKLKQYQQLVSIRDNEDGTVLIEVVHFSERDDVDTTKQFNIGRIVVTEVNFVTYITKITNPSTLRQLINQYEERLTANQRKILNNHLSKLSSIKSEDKNGVAATQENDEGMIVYRGPLEIAIQRLVSSALRSYDEAYRTVTIQGQHDSNGTAFGFPLGMFDEEEPLKYRITELVKTRVHNDLNAHFKVLEISGNTPEEIIFVIGVDKNASSAVRQKSSLSALTDNGTRFVPDKSMSTEEQASYGGIDMNVDQIDLDMNHAQLTENLYNDIQPVDAAMIGGIVPIQILLFPLKGQLPLILGLMERGVPASREEYT